MFLNSNGPARDVDQHIDRPASFLIQHTKSTVLVYADIVSAILAVLVSVTLSNAIRPLLGARPIAIESFEFTFHISIIFVFTVALFAWFTSKGHYRRREALINRLGQILGGCGMALICAAATQFATVEVGSRLLTLSYWLLLVPLIIIGRLIAGHILRSANIWTNNADLFTAPNRADQVSKLIEKHDELGIVLTKKFFCSGNAATNLLNAMRAATSSGSVIIYAPAPEDQEQHEVLESLVAEGLPFMFSAQSSPLPNQAEVHSYPLEDISVLEVPDVLARPLALATKRLFDIAVSFTMLLVLSPVFIIISSLIKLDGGPAMFRQERLGRNGEVFKCLKFRSMIMNAEERLSQMIASDPKVAAEWNAYQKLQKDPRITRIGKIIRKANLDELPQLINILRGDMSLVGPRPMTIPQIEEYGPSIAAYKRMRPGITGIWQTNGRNSTTFAERARMDAWYVRNWSLWRDFIILVRTFREVLFARGG